MTWEDRPPPPPNQPMHQNPQAQLHYAPPAGFAPPGGYGRPRRPSRWMAVTALSIAIPAALLRFVPFIGGVFILPVIVAIVFAIVALAVHTRGRGMSIAALIIGVVGLVVPTVLTLMRVGLLGISLFGFIQDNV